MKLSEITSGIIERPPRVIICGTSKIGKSTFASQFPNVVYISVAKEEGIDALDVARFPVAESFADVMAAIESLATEENTFKHVVIDSISALEPLIWEDVCAADNVQSIEKVGGGFGKGYIEAVKRWRDLMAGLDYLRDNGIGSILIAHVAIKTFIDPSGDNYDAWELDLNKKAVSTLERWADAILFANCKVFTKTEKSGMKESKKGVLKNERVLFTQKRPSHPGGGRGVYGQLPAELELSYEAWQNAIAERKAE